MRGTPLSQPPERDFKQQNQRNFTEIDGETEYKSETNYNL